VRSATLKEATRLSAWLLLTAAFGIMQAQAKPNLTGTWKVDVTKSDFGSMPAPDSQTEVITHEDPNLKISVAQTGEMGDLNFDLAYTTDGKECTNTVAGNEMKSTLNWDGDDLVIDTKGNFDGTDFTAKDRWKLSEDGKTITIDRHISSAMGDADQKILLEKQ
jgi:hypothetical protein